jgi:hypothetical protein
MEDRYVVDGCFQAIDAQNNIITDITAVYFSRTTGIETTAELEAIMPDATKTIAQNMENVIKSYLLNLISTGEL